MAFCTFCGARLKEDAKFCASCGAKVVATVRTPPQQPVKEAAPVVKKRSGWWKWIAVPVVIVLAVAIFNGKAERDELLRYINEDLQELGEMDDEMRDSFNSVVGTDYVDDYTLYTEISENTMELCQELCEAARELEFKNKELRDVHKIFIRYTSEFRKALIKVQEAALYTDYDAAIEANEYLDEVYDIADEFNDELEKLAHKYGVILYEE